jgi:hypothetical protein
MCFPDMRSVISKIDLPCSGFTLFGSLYPWPVRTSFAAPFAPILHPNLRLITSCPPVAFWQPFPGGTPTDHPHRALPVLLRAGF